MPLFDLKRQLLFYGQYHHDPVNVAIHITCVPLILLTAFHFGSNGPQFGEIHLPIPYATTSATTFSKSSSFKDALTNTTGLASTSSMPGEVSLPINPGTIGALVYAAIYVLLEPFAGAILAPFLVGSAVYSTHLTAVSPTVSNYIAIGMHVMSWLAQFVGHGVYEGRAPALLDNLVQAIVLAPLFVWLEILFKFGYRPKLQKELEIEVNREVAKYKQSKAQEKVAAK